MRLLAATVALATVLVLAVATSATAMWGQTFQTGLTIMPDNSMTLAGPVGFTEEGEVATVVHATVVQAGSKAVGDSQYIERTDPTSCTKGALIEPMGCAKRWVAPMTIVSGSFHTGKANAKMVADVYYADGDVEKYSWAMQVDVVSG